MNIKLLREKPFYLNETEQKWVTDTLDRMTEREKCGQLFVVLGNANSEDGLRDLIENWGVGGVLFRPAPKETVSEQYQIADRYAKIPLLKAANLEEGGAGVISDGTYFGNALQVAAADDLSCTESFAKCCAKEGRSVGVNWTYSPVVDIDMNFRNPITNVRTFGSDTDKVLAHAEVFVKTIQKYGIAASCKHFPGDGVEELDQHLALGINDLSVEDWNKSFRRVYETMIDEGLETIMVGHIALPEMSRRLRPGITDAEIMPATLAPELLGDLLRGEMGFNGLIITDATHMVGFSATAKRGDAVPGAIAAGCDMILFANDVEEDIGYVKAAYEKGLITEERLSDALHRVLGLKAHLHLYEESVRCPDKAGLDLVGCEEHKAYAEEAADTCVTLVKDTRHLIPVNPAEKKRAYLVYVQSTPTSKGYQGDPVKKVIQEELERAGFEVDLCPNYHDLEVENGVSPMNFIKMLGHGSRQEFIDSHDVVFLFINIKGYAQENNVRVRWSCNHSCELPWYNEEVPTVGVSLNFTNHLIDVPQLHTFVNAYGPTRAHIRAAIEKICGKSAFKGTAGETVFCGRWDTRR